MNFTRKDRPMLFQSPGTFVAHIRELMSAKVPREIPLLQERGRYVAFHTNKEGEVTIMMRYIGPRAIFYVEDASRNSEDVNRVFADIRDKFDWSKKPYNIGGRALQAYSKNFPQTARWDIEKQTWCVNDLPYGIYFHSRGEEQASIFGLEEKPFGNLILVNFMSGMHAPELALRVLRRDHAYNDHCDLIEVILALNPS